MWGVYGAAVSGHTMVSLQFYKTFSEVFRRKTGSRCWKPVNSSHFYNLLEFASKEDSRNKYLSMYLFVCMKIKYIKTILYLQCQESDRYGERQTWNRKWIKNNWLQIFTFQSEDCKDMESLRKYALTSLICIATCSIPPQQQEPVKLHHD